MSIADCCHLVYGKDHNICFKTRLQVPVTKYYKSSTQSTRKLKAIFTFNSALQKSVFTYTRYLSIFLSPQTPLDRQKRTKQLPNGRFQFLVISYDYKTQRPAQSNLGEIIQVSRMAQ